MNRLYEIIKMYHSGDIYKIALWRINTMLPLLNEKQRRAYLACEARALGSRGVNEVSKMTGVARKTIYIGLQELDKKSTETAKIRRAPRDGVRIKNAQQKHPDIMKELRDLIEGPQPGKYKENALSYISKNSKAIAEALKEKGLPVSAFTVAGLLKDSGYRLQAHRDKTAAKDENPDAEAQARYVNKMARSYMARGEAVLCIDIMKIKKEEGGKPDIPVEIPESKLKEAAPYGVYKLFQNAGFTNVDLDDPAAALAVRSLEQWWKETGLKHYSRARRILITANFRVSRIGILKFQELANRWEKVITLLLFPQGISRWNAVGHQFVLFNRTPNGKRETTAGKEASGETASKKETAGEAAAASAAVISLISAAKIEPPLTIEYGAEGGGSPGEKGVTMHIKPHNFRGDWNYFILPEKKRGRPLKQEEPAAPL
jgi:transposase